MAKTFTHNFTPERLSELEKSKLEVLHENAERLGQADLLAMCKAELNARRPTRAARSASASRDSDVVIGYHFVCGHDLGVTQVGDGRFWSGSWVVAEDRANASLVAGAYLALHAAKSELSYRQGKIVGHRKAPRDMVAKRNEGIEFLVETSATPLTWVGDGAGEKGYNWASEKAEEEK